MSCQKVKKSSSAPNLLSYSSLAATPTNGDKDHQRNQDTTRRSLGTNALLCDQEDVADDCPSPLQHPQQQLVGGSAIDLALHDWLGQATTMLSRRDEEQEEEQSSPSPYHGV